MFVCRCNHLTTIGGVYEPNSVSKRSDPRVGIYLTYFAMNYWKKSFGYYLLWPATILYGVSLGVAIIIDCFTLSKMRRKIEERIIHVGESNEKQAKEAELKGLLEEEKKLDSEISPDTKGKSKPKSKVKRKKGLDDTVVEDKGYHSQGDNDSAIDALNITGDHVLAPMPKKKKKIIKRKVLKKKAKNNFVQEEGGEEEKKNGLNRYASTSSIAIRMPVEEEKEVSLHSGLRQSKINGGKKLKKKKIIRKKKKKPIDTFDDLNSKADTKIQGSGSKVDDNMLSHYNSEGDKDKEGSVSSDPDTKEVSPEETPKIHKMPTTVDVFESSRNFWSMLLYSNTFCNLIFVTSYLCPRHIRISMLYTNLILIWFLVAVFYNNTKDPLVVPDFEAKARSLAMSEIWIALAAPLVSMSISYIFWGVFRVSDKRFHQPDSYLRVKDGQMMKALLREMYLRFAMAYFIMMAIFSAVLWYIIEFTAKFGWKVSWQWWYSGSFAFLFNYLFYDPLITWFHFVMYGCSQILWRKVMAFRGIKIACPEVLDHLHIPPLEDPNQKGENNPDGQAQNAEDAEPREP